MKNQALLNKPLIKSSKR